ncbi:PD-(D/E)XK nuclease family protein [Ligilactobacillus sp.]|uniref:PD-(D/E)XK nuclease family protein n=1 Tax=Ligilactobacillus sp. TaxID=2767921 RepID=UPI002FE38998
MNSELNKLLNKVDEWSKKNRKVYILTTPDMVDDLELVVLKHLAGKCSAQIAMATAEICVTTPERMAVKEMTGKHPEFCKPELTGAVQTQLVSLAIEQSKDELKTFRKSAGHPGFARNVRSLFSRCLDDGYSASVLGLRKYRSKNESFKKKMEDLIVIYKKYLELSEPYMTKNEMLDILKEDFDGEFFFAYFGPKKIGNRKEDELLKELKKKAEEGIEVFLPDAAEKYGPDVMKRFFKEHVMKHQPGRYDEVNVTKAKCLDPDLEAKWTAGKIVGLLEADDSLHARDIVVYLPPKNRDYIQATDRAFRKAGLSFNLKQESSLSSLPLPQLLRSLFENPARRYEVSNIIRLLRTGLVLPDSNEDEGIDEKLRELNSLLPKIDNFLRKTGTRTEEQWKTEWHDALYSTEGAGENLEYYEKCNAFAEDIRKKTVSLFSDLDAMKNPLDEKTGIMSVLSKNGILDAHAAQSAKNTRTVKARGIDFEGITGRMKESRKRFTDLIFSLSAAGIEVDSSAFAGKLKETFSEPYATGHAEKVDEVKVVPIDAVQCPHYRHAFVLGLDRNTLPGSIPEGRILTREEEEENILFVHSMTIMDRYKYTDTLFLDACASASDGIFLSYSQNTVLADPNEPSHYWTGFDAPVEDVGLSTTFNVPEFDIDAAVVHASSVHLKEEQKDEWNHLKNLTAFENRPSDLTPELAEKLYAGEMKADGCHISPSYSALDAYAKNPYEFFLSKGLRLRRKDDYVLSSKNSGTYIHDLLEAFTNGEFNVPGNSDFDVQKTASSAIEHVAENRREKSSRNSGHERDILSMLSATAQTRRFKERLEDTFRRCLVALKKRQKENHSQMALGETGFNSKDSIRNVESGIDIPFELDGKTFHLDLSGVIDCISVINRDGGDSTELMIADYKTGNFRDLTQNLVIKLENGMNLQLVIYAMLIRAHIDEVRRMLEERGFEVRDRIAVTGSEYVRVNDEKNNGKEPDRFCELRISDEAYSKVERKRNGQPSFSDPVPLKNVEDLIIDAYRNILSGHLEISPYQLGSKNGLKHSDFRNIMCFDELFGNSYRELKSRNTDTEEN